MTIRPDLVKGKRITILGMARTGLAVAKLLQRYGARPFVSEIKPRSEVVSEAEALEAVGIRFETGGHSRQALDDVDFCIISPGIAPTAPFVQEITRRHLPLFSEIEVTSWLCPATILAITGANGKSTTTTLLAHIIRESGRQTVATGNIGSPFAADVEQLSADDYAVVEVSSFQLEHTDTFKPKVAAILNITADHLDRYGNISEYAQAKYRIADSQDQTDYIVLNQDDPLTVAPDLWGKPQRLHFSTREEVASGVFVRDDQLGFTIGERSGTICPTAAIGIPGPHNLANAAAASSVALAIGIDPEAIARGLATFRGIAHRLEPVAEINQVRFVNDSKATNIDSVKVALQSVKTPIILIMGGRDKGADFSSLAKLVGDRVKLLLLIGEAAAKIDAELSTITEVVRLEDIEQAVNHAYQRAAPGDTVLLSPGCASFDQFRDFEDRG
ncbi:MAG: UDP-N-acetylmuramoyl-L-alanine--D-glutamate ligase, partial [candidate division Zixibacteria bacterium]|nr:UDP-N-acetylmuramoyl-L-alanine--D-glutamate ligase [candidate division Zixibacteria bacterium]